MKRSLLMLLIGILVAAVFVLLQLLFTVREGEVAVLTTFGRPVRATSEPGLYHRWPWPVQRVYTFDGRIRCMEGPLQETITRDGKNILVSIYAGWKIADPTLFLERVGTAKQAERNLDGLLHNYKNATLGQYPFSSLINEDPEKIRFAEIEERILQAAAPEAEERYGIDLRFIGIRKFELPEAITEKVFERMRAERNELAEQYRSEGEGRAIRIRAEADTQREQILAAAEGDAKRIRAEGDAAAAEYYQVFEEDPDLAMFLRKLEVMEKTLGNNATVVLGADTEPYDLLQGTDALLSK